MSGAISILLAENFSSLSRNTYLFADEESAFKVFKTLTEQVKAYYDRDCERFITFDYLLGSAVVDVSKVVTLETENIFGEHADALSKYNRRVGELRMLAYPKELGV